MAKVAIEAIKEQTSLSEIPLCQHSGRRAHISYQSLGIPVTNVKRNYFMTL